MYIQRELTDELLTASRQYPVVMVTGPRQSGKTTLVKMVFPDKPYYSFENPDTRAIFAEDPRAFFQANPAGAIIDEFQRYPELLSYMQGIVDEKKQQGMFILTGSNNINMVSNITQSLAGRVSLLKLLPFSIAEIALDKVYLLTDTYLLNGFYPAIYSDKLNPTKAYRNYYETYLERDVRQIINLKELFHFQRFIKLCAGRIGQLFNISSISSEVGVSTHTINSWLSVLQATYAVILVQPWHSNLNKRLVKTPKIYFYDVGLASYLLGIENEKHISSHPLRGALFENMVMVELLKKRYNAGLDNNIFFYRDNHGNEIDVIQESGHKLKILEIKSSQTFLPQFIKGLEHFKNLLPDRIESSGLVYTGDQQLTIQGNQIVNYKNLDSIKNKTDQ